jgi:nitrite reductase/ring-hydroxylating ferredoxin subunit
MNGAPPRLANRPPLDPTRVDRLCGVDEVPEGECRRVKVDGRPALAVFNVGGDFFVIDDVCSHGMASLSEGLAEDGIVECPWHGGAFDVRTGAAVRHPCVVAVRSYVVEIRDGAVHAGRPRPVDETQSVTQGGGGKA